MATTPNKTKMSNMDMSQLRAFAIGLGFDPNQFPQYDDPSSSSSRVAFRKWIKDEMEKQGRGNELKIGHQISAPAPADPASPTPADPAPAATQPPSSPPPPAEPADSGNGAAQPGSSGDVNWLPWIIGGLVVLALLIGYAISRPTQPATTGSRETPVAEISSDEAIDALRREMEEMGLTESQIEAALAALATDTPAQSVMCPWLYRADGTAQQVGEGFDTDPFDGQVYTCQENGQYYPIPPAELFVPPTMDSSTTAEAPVTDESNGDDPSEEGEETPEAEVASTTESCGVPTQLEVFDAPAEWDWNELDTQTEPSFEAFLDAHNLAKTDIQQFDAPEVSWEPAQYVVELDESLYGVQEIPLIEGYLYNVALCDGRVINFWGGDPEVSSVTLQWGFTARWVDSYQDLPYEWLDPDNMTEYLVRENRFGRYRRSPESELPGLPYFDRFGPYQTLSGNVSDWQPPSLDAVEPRDYRDAAAMLGGLAVESEWKDNGDSWTWKYSEKEPGSGDYCPQGMPCWQTTYMPPASTGYIELWDGDLGGPRKFYATDLATLVSGRYNVDEFTYHPYSGD